MAVVIGICAAGVAAFLSSTYWLWALLLVVFVLSVLLVVFMYSRYTTLMGQKQEALEKTYLKYETKFAARKSYAKVGADEIIYMIAKKHWVTNSPGVEMQPLPSFANSLHDPNAQSMSIDIIHL